MSSLYEGTHQREAGDSHASRWWGHCESYALLVVQEARWPRRRFDQDEHDRQWCWRSDPLSAKGVASMELTIGSKTLATAFFIAEVQGNYNLILGRDWIHANQCVPSTLHQFLVQ